MLTKKQYKFLKDFIKIAKKSKVLSSIFRKIETDKTEII